MPTVFPGMDPYLEHPRFWPDLHDAVIEELARQLESSLPPDHDVAVYARTYAPSPPTSCQAEERYLEILDLRRARATVAVIEVVSPANKRPGPGRQSYLSKQRQVVGSAAHLIEIDLLRGGRHVVSVAEWNARWQGEFDYLVCVSRAGPRRDQCDLYLRTVRERLPRIRVPLAPGESDVPLDLQEAIARVYDSGGYGGRIDYGRACDPPLDETHLPWMAEVLQGSESPPGEA